MRVHPHFLRCLKRLSMIGLFAVGGRWICVSVTCSQEMVQAQGRVCPSKLRMKNDASPPVIVQYRKPNDQLGQVVVCVTKSSGMSSSATHIGG